MLNLPHFLLIKTTISSFITHYGKLDHCFRPNYGVGEMNLLHQQHMNMTFSKKYKHFQWVNSKDNRLAMVWPTRHFSIKQILELSAMVAHPLKKAITGFGFAAMLGFAGIPAAHAFTETKVAPPVNQPAPLTETPKLQLEKPDEGSGLSLMTPGDSSSGETELNIPGVGSIGKLPKLDFGLELLYGGGTGQGAETPLDDKNDDVLIKGKIRHRF